MSFSRGTIFHFFLHVVLCQVVLRQLDLSLALQDFPPTTPTRRQVVQSLTLAGGIVATTTASSSPSAATVTFSNQQPGPLLRLIIPSAPGESSSQNKILVVPRVGYSLYKTPVEQVPNGVRLALQAGVRHFDVATQYGTNEQVGTVLQDYIQNGLSIAVGKDAGNEARARTSSKRAQEARRKELFISHKVSNAEQSLDRTTLHKAIMTEANRFGKNVDLVMIHSPLTNKQQRLATYESLLELQRAGKVQAIGVCNYGVNPLQEIVTAGFPAPAVIQLILSPFNQHKDVAAWAAEHGSALQCSAWSKLSSKEGPEQGWAVVADLAKKRGMTKAQVLVRWAVQKGYLCVPRSSSKFKIERQAISENSWKGTSSFVLSQAEMDILDGLDEQIPAGRLGIIDGWDDSAIVNDKWDPTTAV